MKTDRKSLFERSWAIPAISGLLILHDDFNTPRLAEVNRLIWSESSVDVYLRYGICNLSGAVIDSIDIVVTLYRKGAVGIRILQDVEDYRKQGLIVFIAGEVAREAVRWAEDMKSWAEGEDVNIDRASILSIVSALIAHPLPDMHVVIEKDRGCIRKACLLGTQLVTDVTAFGIHGASLYVKGHGAYAGVRRLHQEHDMRQGSAQGKSVYARFFKDALFAVRRLLLLPLNLLLYLGETRQTEISDWVDYLPVSLVDARAGESLSALSN